VKPLYLLAFDHRSSFSRDLFGIQGAPRLADVARIADAKAVVYEGFELVRRAGTNGADSGILVDEQFGAAVACRARSAGAVLAMPVEQSGRDEFEFEFGGAFGRHIEAYDPQYAKVLVRYNPDGDRGLNERQAKRLRELSDWLRARRRKLLFELLVPPAEAQLARVAGDRARYDAALRPDLVVRGIRELQGHGVEPDIWKIEGLDRREHCVAAARQARAGGREHVTCIVLGRGADSAQVVRWLEAAAGVPGFAGFAVGRTLWWDALAAYVVGDLDRPAAAERIAVEYGALMAAYERARAA
jgi:myo-inositol catabolism protein IolC